MAVSLEQLIQAGVGLRLRESDVPALASWVAGRCRALALPSEQDYVALLKADHGAGRQEREALTIRLTAPETYFFRDQGQFQLLAERILPDLIARRAGQRSLRIWSAGCSTGEEAYSLAMLLLELSPQLSGWDVKVIATDINSTALQVAEAGRFGEWSFRALDAQRKERYFRPHGKLWEIDRRLGDLVEFRQADLIRDDFAGQVFDLIVCRNVFIYLNAAATARIVTKFSSALAEEAYLVTGHGELLGHHTAGLQTRVFAQSVVLQKSRPEVLEKAHHALPVPVEPAPRPALSRPLPFIRVPLPSSAKVVRPAPIVTVDLLDRAWALADRGLASEAEAACAQAIAAAPFDPWPYYLQAQLAQEAGRPLQARQWLKKVIYLDPKLVSAYLELSALFEQDGEPGRARQMLETARRELRSMPADAAIQPYAETSAADLLAYVERRLGAALPGEPNPELRASA